MGKENRKEAALKMAPAYGNMLRAFPELMKDYEVFKMEPRLGGGYGPRYDIRNARGYMSWRKGGKGDVEGGLKTPNQKATFWEQCDLMTGKSNVKMFDFVEAKGEILQFIEDDDFSAEGGFVRWALQKAPVLDGRQHTNPKVDTAIRDDYA
jgi:hypothetical protein